MKTKEALLELFEANKGTYFSGEEIAWQLHVSRTAVWKAVKSLQNEGYHIDGVSNKGYCLSRQTDIVSPQGIGKYLNAVCAGIELAAVNSTGSTNALAREQGAAGRKEGYAVIANAQTNGAGRAGRSFFSPPDTGVYLSLLLRPSNYEPGKAVKLTTMAAVAVCEAIEAVSEAKAQIKWVNDIYIDGKKVSGILTEASFSLENGRLDHAVLGVGINVYPPQGGFPSELEGIAGAVFEARKGDGKNRLAAEFLNCFMKYYTSSEPDGYVEKYRSRSLVTDREVEVGSGEGAKRAVVLGIDDACRLMVQYEDGSRESLSSGEISINF